MDDDAAQEDDKAVEDLKSPAQAVHSLISNPSTGRGDCVAPDNGPLRNSRVLVFFAFCLLFSRGPLKRLFVPDVIGTTILLPPPSLLRPTHPFCDSLVVFTLCCVVRAAGPLLKPFSWRGPLAFHNGCVFSYAARVLTAAFCKRERAADARSHWTRFLRKGRTRSRTVETGTRWAEAFKVTPVLPFVTALIIVRVDEGDPFSMRSCTR